MAASKKGRLVAASIWITVIIVGAVVTKFVIFPAQKDKLTADTGSSSQYQHEIKIAHDSFSGYAILRSDLMRSYMKAEGIKLSFHDDAADYEARIKSLRDGDVQMAVFTVDSLITSSISLGEFPATIVMIIDETRGADAVVAYENPISSIQSLDREDAKVVLTRNSPSDFLWRVVYAHFNIPRFSPGNIIEADGSGDVLKKLRKGKGKPLAFVLWEPELSKAKEIAGVHVLLGSDKLSGYIVDVLVAERGFLSRSPELVRQVIESYLKAGYSYRQQQQLVKVIQDDGKLTDQQAKSIVDGIAFKNAMENYAYFGLVTGGKHIEDIIIDITDVLVKTGMFASNPIDGRENSLYYDTILADMQSDSFHPGRKMNLLGNVGGMSLADVATEKRLPKLTESEWNSLIAVGNLQVNAIRFARGRERLNIQAERDLRDLADRLSSWPQYYLLIVGHSTAKGDPDANRQLSLSRSEAVAEYLRVLGVDENRVSAIAAPSTRDGKSRVSFVVGQQPY